MSNNAEPTNDPLADQSFITSEPCQAPCWYGLELDKSNTKDVKATLKSLSFVDPTSIRDGTSPWLDDDFATVISWDCIHPKLEGCGLAHISEDKLKQIWMKAGYRLDVQMAVATLGRPDYIDYGFQDPASGCLLFMEWPEQGITIYSEWNDDSLCQSIQNGTKIPANILITKLVYMVQAGFSPTPSVCCTRTTWPGLEE
jgi:hypothetical protein